MAPGVAARSHVDLALEQGWPEERIARDLKWRRVGFPEEQANREMVAFIGATYKVFFREDPPWYIFEPGELGIMRSLTIAEQQCAHASAVEATVTVYEERGRISDDQARQAHTYVHTTRARAAMYGRQASRSRPAPSQRRHVRGPRARRTQRTRQPARASPSSSSEDDPEPPLAALERGRK